VSWKATAFVSELSKYPDGTPITRDEKLILFILADHHNISSNDAWPSVTTMADQALMSERHARDILRKAERHGLLETSKGGGRGKKSSYKFTGMEIIPGKPCRVSEPDIDSKSEREEDLNPAPYLPGLSTIPGTNPANTRHKPGTTAIPNKEETGNSKLKPSPFGVTSVHALIRKNIQETYGKFVGVKCPWDGSEAKQLTHLLESNPSWTTEQILEMVKNRYASDCVNGQRPRQWLSRLSDYARGPLDQYGKLKPNSRPSGEKQKSASQLMRESLLD
jgi:hypothetical protein